ncbi:hypothetical protein Sste5346_005112 [Sporothrix stenoceras]|uniref:Uncharacterized protein n=1 Tax=Sporothrix stenoceras TaxID=5173 RepID=A0ABR3Z612_9PEZI
MPLNSGGGSSLTEPMPPYVDDELEDGKSSGLGGLSSSICSPQPVSRVLRHPDSPIPSVEVVPLSQRLSPLPLRRRSRALTSAAMLLDGPAENGQDSLSDFERSETEDTIASTVIPVSVDPTPEPEVPGTRADADASERSTRSSSSFNPRAVPFIHVSNAPLVVDGSSGCRGRTHSVSPNFGRVGSSSERSPGPQQANNGRRVNNGQQFNRGPQFNNGLHPGQTTGIGRNYVPGPNQYPNVGQYPQPQRSHHSQGPNGPYPMPNFNYSNGMPSNNSSGSGHNRYRHPERVYGSPGYAVPNTNTGPYPYSPDDVGANNRSSISPRLPCYPTPTSIVPIQGGGGPSNIPIGHGSPPSPPVANGHTPTRPLDCFGPFQQDVHGAPQPVMGLGPFYPRGPQHVVPSQNGVNTGGAPAPVNFRLVALAAAPQQPYEWQRCSGSTGRERHDDRKARPKSPGYRDAFMGRAGIGGGCAPMHSSPTPPPHVQGQLQQQFGNQGPHGHPGPQQHMGNQGPHGLPGPQGNVPNGSQFGFARQGQFQRGNFQDLPAPVRPSPPAIMPPPSCVTPPAQIIDYSVIDPRLLSPGQVGGPVRNIGFPARGNPRGFPRTSASTSRRAVCAKSCLAHEVKLTAVDESTENEAGGESNNTTSRSTGTYHDENGNDGPGPNGGPPGPGPSAGGAGAGGSSSSGSNGNGAVGTSASSNGNTNGGIPSSSGSTSRGNGNGGTSSHNVTAAVASSPVSDNNGVSSSGPVSTDNAGNGISSLDTLSIAQVNADSIGHDNMVVDRSDSDSFRSKNWVGGSDGGVGNASSVVGAPAACSEPPLPRHTSNVTSINPFVGGTRPIHDGTINPRDLDLSALVDSVREQSQTNALSNG